jgi:hypothetical protein
LKESAVTTIQITLPDQLAKEAEEAGLLSPESLERMLRQKLDAPSLKQVFDAVDRGNANDDTPYMSPEAIAEEIRAMRAEKRASSSTPASVLS